MATEQELKQNTPPAELPKTLPAGTRWVSGECHGEFIGEARLDDGWYQGRSVSVWGAVTQQTDHERLIPVGIPVGLIDWSSVPAPAKDECWIPKVGARVTWDEKDNVFRTRDSSGSIACVGTIVSIGERATVKDVTGIEACGPDDRWLVSISAIRAVTGTSWIPKAGDRVRVKESCVHAQIRGKSVASEKLRVDPYATHNAALATNPVFAAWSREQDLAVDRRLREIKAAIDKRRGEVRRTGPLLDRDRYGQKLSLRGWDSDDVESV